MSPRPRDPLPPVLYEDEAVIAFDKPSGLLSAPDRWDKGLACLIDLVRERLSPEYANVHRLDRDASGILLFAKNAEALRCLRGQFDSRQVGKAYLALTCPGPQADRAEVDAPLAPDARRPGRTRVSREGKESRTDYEVLERFSGGWTLLRAEPQTGRTHQVRVHLAHAGCPIVGDGLYGGAAGLYLSQLKRAYKRGREPERPLMGRLALHARGVSLRHPVTGETLTIESPLPHDFEVGLKYLRRFAR